MKREKVHNKFYEAPQIKVIDIEVEQNILSGSNGKTFYHFENDNIDDLIVD